MIATGPGDQRGRYAQDLATWREQLAAGTPWGDVEVDVLACCRGRIDLLTRLLLEAEAEATRFHAGRRS